MSMLYDPNLLELPKVLSHLERLFSRLGDDVVVYHLEEPEVVGSFRMIVSMHTTSPITNASYKAFIGKTIDESFPTFLQNPNADFLLEALRTGHPQSLPAINFPDEKAKQKTCKVTAYPLDSFTVAVLIKDITETERLKNEHEIAINELALKAKNLENLNQELEQFAYVASHDLKSPLRDIDNLASWIAEDAEDHLPEASMEHLVRLRSRAERMMRLLDDLLEYSRIGKTESQSQSLDINALLGDIRGLISLPENFQLKTPNDIPKVSTPKVPLEQVFLNLISNSLKHHDRNQGQVEIRWTDKGEFLEFKVADDGPGIPIKYQDRIFALFTTLQPRDKVEGSGMGLAIVKKLITSHGGQITVESSGERGCAFRFTWPKEFDV